jgi:Leucine-rich repeat (LRR) protein
MKKLKYLEISDNQITEIPEGISKLENLEYLSFQNNQITSLPEKLTFLRKLQTLDIRGNKIPMPEIEILKLSLPKCRILFDAEEKKEKK